MMNPALPKTWHYVYLLSNKTMKWIYIGCTNDLEKRLDEHYSGKVLSTKNMLPVELVYYEAYRFKEDAYIREKHLKHHGSSFAKLKYRIGIQSVKET